MTMPETTTQGDPMLLEILNRVSDIGTDVAVIKSQMAAVPDHEQRIRELRSQVPPDLAQRLSVVESAIQQATGAKDTQARWTSWVAVGGAIAAGVAGYLHH